MTPGSSRQPLLTVMIAAVGIILTAGNGRAEPVGGQVVNPGSSVEQPSHIGRIAHTNIKIFVPSGGMANVQPPSRGGGQQSEPGLGYYETPASLGCIYSLTTTSRATHTACNPADDTLVNPAGGAKAIAIVDAYDYPSAMSDLQLFSAQFGLLAPNDSNFQVVYASGTRPKADNGWGLEAALDIQWAHAMAPKAKIYLVEAASNSFADLLTAVNVASNLVANAGGGQVSMSWGGSEFPFEKNYDSYFTKSSVVYFAAAGDGPGVIWPSASPNVVSAGGTSLSRDASGNFQAELAWSSTGGGPSKYESRPPYQQVISQIVGKKRGTPDLAADADPNTGVWVYNTPDCGGWCIVGGTSVAAPVWAGIINAAGRFSTSSSAELTTVYSNIGTGNFSDITQGVCGPNLSYLTASGWDFCTGVGSDVANQGK
jgi:kumamolisin